jgi:hypothetical protein
MKKIVYLWLFISFNIASLVHAQKVTSPPYKVGQKVYHIIKGVPTVATIIDSYQSEDWAYKVQYENGSKSKGFEDQINFTSIPEFPEILPKKYLTVLSFTNENFLSPKKSKVAFGVNVQPKLTNDCQLIDIHYASKEQKIYVMGFPNDMSIEVDVYDFYILESFSFDNKQKKSITEAYLKAVEYICKRFPSENYALKYTGHGTYNGTFEGTLVDKEYEYFLEKATQIQKKVSLKDKFAFFDWSTLCENNSWANMKVEYKYADYILGSELMRGGILYNPPNEDETDKILDASTTYLTHWNKNKSIEEGILHFLEVEKTIFNNLLPFASKQQIPQSINLYKTASFKNIQSVLEQGLNDAKIIEKASYSSFEYEKIDLRIVYDATNKGNNEWDNFLLKRIVNHAPNQGLDWGMLPNYKNLKRAKGIFTYK